MASIFASKLYASSKRKNKIHSSISDPTNQALVQQLSSYLGEDVKQQLAHEQSQHKEDMRVRNSIDNDPEGSASTSDRGSGEPAKFMPAPSLSGKISDSLHHQDDLDEKLNNDVPDVSEGNSDEEPESDPEPTSSDIEESVTINSTTLVQDVKTAFDGNVLKGSLNANADTAGVSRVVVKDNEVWIYYNDNTNLNNVMSQVIDKVYALGYDYMDFNRLARSDNAMVFVMTVSSDVIPEGGDK